MPIVNSEKKQIQSVSVVIPAFNEAQVIASVVARIHETMKTLNIVYEVLVIDDGSQDDTARAASEAGAEVILHPYNIGNGAAVKTGIRSAAGDAIVLMDGDGQHQPEDIPLLLDGLKKYHMVVGARNKETEAELHRNIANSAYNVMASYICDREIQDLTSGFRAIRKNVALEFLNILPNTFSYPTTLTLAVVRSGYGLLYVPIKVFRRTGKSKIKLFQDGTRFLLIILKITTLFSPMKVFLPISILMFLLGFGYGIFKIVFLGTRYGPTSAMLMTVSVVVFLIGLVSEQIAQSRYR
ncbi:MAG: glycosyltransferase family 2 protein [Anaerolineales bacterium]|nr:glycosyltransferase family 2 protein [Anaerolineales bacterium]